MYAKLDGDSPKKSSGYSSADEKAQSKKKNLPISENLASGPGLVFEECQSQDVACIKGEIEDASPQQEENKQPRRIRLEQRFSGNSNVSDKENESDIVNQNSSREEPIFMQRRSQ